MKKIARLLSVFICLVLLINSVCITASAADGAVGDQMVYLTQKWLNQNYGGVAGFGSVPENGRTGYDTVYGLLRALQIELGIQAPANSFGPSTTAAYSENILRREDGKTDKKYAILQGALWCKGYSPGYKITERADGTVVFDEVFDSDVERAVIALKTDMGFNEPDGVVTLNVMKALMTMDSYRLSGGSFAVRQVQQLLNSRYEAYIGIIPCDGVYGRSTSKALITALQAEEGLPVGTANGNFGSTTKSLLPDIPYTGSAKSYSGEPYSAAQIARFTELLNCALTVNGYGGSEQGIRDFQRDMALTVTGRADTATWMSLLVSHGDTSRPALAADCMTKLTAEKAKTLYEYGYRYIGRYLTVESKAITREEAQIIFDAGLKFFPIYQTTANAYEYFTAQKGSEDAQKAIAAARELGLPKDTVIYFAVDFDCTDSHITNGVLPYFKSVHEGMKNSGYRVGVYGTRNACIRVSDKGYAVYSFVSNMSSGYSGNLGFKMPSNWAFDQFATVTVGTGSGRLEIDKNGYSGRDGAVSALVPESVEIIDTTTIFKDVQAGKWYVDAVNYNYTHKFIAGVDPDRFGVDTEVTRGMFITILARIAGVDTVNNHVTTKFSDVETGKYFTNAIKWASENKIVAGISDREFAPGRAIERQQLCVMIVNFAKHQGVEIKAVEAAIDFKDASYIGNYAKDAVAICQKADIVNGYGAAGGYLFKPTNTASRAEAAQILYKFHKK